MKTSEPENLVGILGHRTDDELLAQWQEHTDSLRWLQSELGHIEMFLRQRLQERGAIEMPHPTLSVRLESKFAGYDPSKMMALKELVSPEVWAEAFTPAYKKLVPVPDTLDARKASGWGKYGKEVAEAIERAELPRVERLVIKVKEVK